MSIMIKTFSCLFESTNKFGLYQALLFSKLPIITYKTYLIIWKNWTEMYSSLGLYLTEQVIVTKQLVFSSDAGGGGGDLCSLELKNTNFKLGKCDFTAILSAKGTLQL